MANLDLTKYGITGATEIIHNPSYEALFEAEMDPSLEGFEKGQLTELGPAAKAGWGSLRRWWRGTRQGACRPK